MRLLHGKFLLILIFGVNALLYGCGVGPALQYHSDKYSYTVAFPDDWRLQPDYQLYDVAAFSTHKGKVGDVREMLAVHVHDREKDLALPDIVNQMMKMGETPLKLELLSNEAATVNGIVAQKFSSAFTVANKRIVDLAVVFCKDDKMYVIECMVGEEHVAECRPLFEQCVESFRFD